MTTDLETAAEIIGIGRTLAYDLVKNGVGYYLNDPARVAGARLAHE